MSSLFNYYKRIFAGVYDFLKFQFGKVYDTHQSMNYAEQWNLVPDRAAGQHLTKDFVFIPEMWGQGVIDVNALQPAGEANFKFSRDGEDRSPATMSTLLMGSNEPDIIGSCMGDSFGDCLEPSCCWGPGVVATGVGFWPFAGCEKEQPLPTMWEDDLCIDSVMGHWQQTAAAARYRGYKYLSTPLVAFNISYIEKFIQQACVKCHSIECGCPVYVGFHFTPTIVSPSPWAAMRASRRGSIR